MFLAIWAIQPQHKPPSRPQHPKRGRAALRRTKGRVRQLMRQSRDRASPCLPRAGPGPVPHSAGTRSSGRSGPAGFGRRWVEQRTGMAHMPTAGCDWLGSVPHRHQSLPARPSPGRNPFPQGSCRRHPRTMKTDQNLAVKPAPATCGPIKAAFERLQCGVAKDRADHRIAAPPSLLDRGLISRRGSGRGTQVCSGRPYCRAKRRRSRGTPAD